MSYEKVKRITIRDGYVRVCSATNNVRPLQFSTWTIKADNVYEAIKEVLLDIVDGNFQLYNNKQNRRWLNVTNDEKVAELNHRIWCWSTPRDEANELRKELHELLMKRFQSEFNL